MFGRNSRAELSAEDEERQKRSWSELKAGRLPLAAQERLAGQMDDHVFTSDLSTRDLVAVRAAGYEPVGQAFGTSIFRVTRANAYASYAIHPGLRNAPIQNRSSRMYNSGPGAVPTADRPLAVSGFYQSEAAARATALRRLKIEAQALDADGVIGVRVVESQPIEGCVEFSLFGTAVRDPRRRRPAGKSAGSTAAAGSNAGSNTRGKTATDQGPPVFLTTLGAADFGQLLRGGWQPLGIVSELVRYGAHGGYLPNYGLGRLNPQSWQPAELTAASITLDSARALARRNLQGQVTRLNATGMILDSFEARLEHDECSFYEGATDYYVDVFAIGNAIARRPPGSSPAGGGSRVTVVPIIRLDRGNPSDI